MTDPAESRRTVAKERFFFATVLLFALFSFIFLVGFVLCLLYLSDAPDRESLAVVSAEIAALRNLVAAALCIKAISVVHRWGNE